jgi:FkbM family methyltransferase
MKEKLKKIKLFTLAYLIYRSLKKLLKDKFNSVEKKSENDFIQFKRVQPWFKVNGDETLRLDYDLNESSTVFDVGGYKGEFSRDIFCKYNSNIFLFEPLPEFYNIASKKFCKNSKVNTLNFGLSDKTFKTLIGLNDNSSSTIEVGSESVEISLISIIDFIRANNISRVDLIKINIEGGEYNLLESVIREGMVSIFKNIQVQFHDFVIENAKERMSNIHEELSKTHILTYHYEFVWENWKLKSEC